MKAQTAEDASVALRLLQAMKLLASQGHNGFCKCALVLRQALQAAGRWSQPAEYAICNDGCEESETKRFYDCLRQLIRDGLAEGLGNLDLVCPAGPRYTECRITAAGSKQLRAGSLERTRKGSMAKTRAVVKRPKHARSTGVLSDYLEAALEQAEYDKLSDGTFSGRIPVCPGVIAFANTLSVCERELRSTLEGWVWLGLKLGHQLPVVCGIDLNKDPKDAPVESV